MKHRHKAIRTTDRCYSGPVSRDENPAAHGGIRECEECICGATRATNVNGRHVEQGPWVEPDHSRDEDCTVVDGECVVCHVWHGGDPCRECSGHGYHRDGCPEIG